MVVILGFCCGVMVVAVVAVAVVVVVVVVVVAGPFPFPFCRAEPYFCCMCWQNVFPAFPMKVN